MKLPFLLLLALTLTVRAASISVTPNVAYKTGQLSEYETTRCKLDVYAPAGAKDLPCLVWFHGGGITAGSKDGKTTIAVAKALAGEGMVVVAVNYRLSPKAKFPAYLDDASASVAWAKANATKYGGNPARLFVSGHSAGGYLTGMLGTDDRLLAAHGVKLTDIAGLIPLSGQMATHYTIREERGLPKTRIIIDEAAPLHHARKDGPPWLILYAEKDMALRGDENRYFAAAMQSAGHKQITLREMAAHDHGGIGNDIAKDGDTVRKALVEFMKSTK